ncbi:GTP cyclohydrolase II [Pelagibius litoralis]|uniref:GTP cyclohydrolase-2 n=1 Tax=Pelagibius litoralis TaxID=374515 RepID=A0A967F212_9PROT|nr:GTP cyclohydrolase II [Pelagibius litoralis]NIA71679.1 GTP cyclohydrolase II [Pelagibius litoralis]
MMQEPEKYQKSADATVLQAVERALAELRRGATIVLHDWSGQGALVQAAEQVSTEGLAGLGALTGKDAMLLLTARRAQALGMAEADGLIASGGVLALALDDREAERIRALADPTAAKAGSGRERRVVTAPPGLDVAAVELTKLARLLPAALLAPLPGAPVQSPLAWADAHDLLAVTAANVAEYSFASARSLAPVADAMVPLAEAEQARIVAFRPDDGGTEHLAIIIGEPDPEAPLLLRLHSECFTGDLLSSLRCDCGEQLRGAIKAMADAGSGILLYLTQEGRGIGLVNKLRAYTLQDLGSDTLDANEQLGFDADERVYLPAAQMLHQLGFRKVRLMTNNPQKVAALSRFGIAVEERVEHSFPSNGHNAFYLATKAERFGHLF